jgi:hypothetical protein
MWIRWGRNGACLVHVNGRNLVGHDLVEEELVWAPAPVPPYPFKIIKKHTVKDIFLQIPLKISTLFK